MALGDVNKTGDTSSTPPPSTNTANTGASNSAKEIIIVPLNGKGEFSAPVADVKNFGSIFNGTVAGKSNTMCMKVNPGADDNKFYCEGFDKPTAMEEKGLQSAKLDIPTEAPKLAQGANFDQTITSLLKDDSFTMAFPKTKPGATYSKTALYKGGQVSDDGNSVKGGKLFATIIQDGDQRYIIDAKGHKLVPDENGNIKKD